MREDYLFIEVTAVVSSDRFIRLIPIGVVKSPLKKWDDYGKGWKETRAKLVIDKKYADGLKGIEDCKYIWILYWMHKLSRQDRRVLLTHPRRDSSEPLKGVFALRSPMRPNPIGLSKVRLMERKDNQLTVDGLDAIDGTPILDIKKSNENDP